MTVRDIDATTGVLRHNDFLSLLEDQLTRARQTSTPLAVVALDVDHLAYVNYYFDPPAGDAAVGMVATVLRAQVRYGILARYGGDEFYALLPHTSLTEALVIAERVRQTAVIIGVDTPAPGTPSHLLSFSLTVVAYPEHGTDVPTLLSQIEQGLREAKRQGRDTVYRLP